MNVRILSHRGVQSSLRIPAMVVTLTLCNLLPVSAESQFCPAYFDGGRGPGDPYKLLVFSPEGQSLTVPLPTGLPHNLFAETFAVDGKAIYCANVVRRWGPDIVKIELDPPRQSVLPESAGFRSVENSQDSDRLFIRGTHKEFDRNVCLFELNLTDSSVRPLAPGVPIDCENLFGPVSPDGKRLVMYVDNQVHLMDLKTRAIQNIKGMETDSTPNAGPPVSLAFSPDGTWLSVVRNGHIALIDTVDLSKRRKLGRDTRFNLSWSPDSKQLLIRKGELRCALTLYFETLEVIDIESGKRTTVKGSRCEIASGGIGWLRCDLGR